MCFWLKDKSSSVDQDPKHLTQLPCNIPSLHLSTFLFSSSRSSSFVVLKTQHLRSLEFLIITESSLRGVKTSTLLRLKEGR